MTSPESRTLAYTKSPKTTKRTTFQDELQAAVSARASKTKPHHYSYYDDFEEDDNDFLNELLKSRKKRTDAFKASKSKSKSNTFELSDDEGKESRTKKVSFLKTPGTSSPSNSTTASESHENETPDSSIGGHTNHTGSFSSQRSTNVSQDNTEFKGSDAEPADPQITSKEKCLSEQTSDDTLLDLPLTLPYDSSVVETPGPEERGVSSQTPPLSTSDSNHTGSAGDVNEKEPPRPKPRQRTLAMRFHATERLPEETEFQDLSSSVSIPLSNDTSSNIGVRNCSPQWTEGDHADSCSPSKFSSNKSERSQLLTKSTDSGPGDGFISNDSKEHERNYSASYEEVNEHAKEHSDPLTHVPEKSVDTRTLSSHSKTTQRSESACSRKVESKYLGTLKVLDRKLSLQDSQPQAADSLRAAIYQEWLQKKSRKILQLKKKEEIQKEKKKKEQENKKEEAIASFEAWKQKKAESLKAKVKEKQDMVSKEQRATEEKEEKRQSAKQVFEQWKRERDHLLKEKHRKQKEAENKCEMKKQQNEEQRRRESKSAFSSWCEKKKNVLHEKHTTERKQIKNKAEEEQYMKEERDKMALEVYEKWLVRKDLEQKRCREERRIQAILQDSPPPPWSPPNKTIPFRK